MSEIIQKYQAALIKLEDGTTGLFTGPAIAIPGDNHKVVSIKFTMPMPLPSGYEINKTEDLYDRN